MAAAPVGQGYTAAQWEAWFAANISASMPTYTGTAKAGTTALKGRTWPNVFAAILASEKKGNDAAAAATLALATEQDIVTGTGQVVGDAVNQTGATEKGLAVSFAPGSVAGFLSAVESRNLWIRVAKIAIGGALVLIGIAHMTGADNAAAAAARKVPIPV